MFTLKAINTGIAVSSIIGLFLSYYALVVETAKEHDDSYKAMCDISEHISCSRVFTSPYGKGFGLLQYIVGEHSILNQPNSMAGLVFYILVIGLTFFDTLPAAKALVILSVLSNIGSVYLACVLYFVLYDFCIVCICTYVINAVNLAFSIMKVKALTPKSTEEHEKKTQ